MKRYIFKVLYSTNINLIIILVPLLLGITIYVFFYPSTVLFNSFLFQIFPALDVPKTQLLYLVSEFRFIPIKSVPTSLWAFSYTYAQAIILLREESIWRNKILFFLNVLLINLLELLQMEEIDLIAGTYDILDIIFNTLGILGALFLFIVLKKLNSVRN